jgi:hypothetical protein
MTAVLKAGIVYFAMIYAIGFVLGTGRVMFMLPLLGELGGVVAEIPVMVLASWIVARWSANKFVVPREVLPRLVMGGIAFALLMVGELSVSILVFGRSLTSTLAFYSSLPGCVGLSAQVIFALLPVAQLSIQRGSR